MLTQMWKNRLLTSRYTLQLVTLATLTVRAVSSLASLVMSIIL